MKPLMFIVTLLLSTMAFGLALQTDKFATAVTIAAPGTNTTKWYDIRNMHYVDFTIAATAGDGTLAVEYASDSSGGGLIVDPVAGAFNNTEAASMIAAGVGKFYVRLKVTCVTAPCTYSGWFTAKGEM